MAHEGVDSFERLADEIVECRTCPRLVEWREQVARDKRAAFRDDEYWGRPVPGFGDPRARVVVVGLAPAAHGANRTGRMFTGDRSGTWLYRALFRAGFANQAESLHRDDGLMLRGAYVTAPVRCAPPANRPTPEERDACHGFFVRELALLRDVRVVVALGRFGYEAVAATVGLSPRPPFAHGLEVSFAGERGLFGDVSRKRPRTRTLVCSYHVSQQNTFTGRLTEPMLDALFERVRALCSMDTDKG